jgi:hypothetical protein
MCFVTQSQNAMTETAKLQEEFMQSGITEDRSTQPDFQVGKMMGLPNARRVT